MKRKKIKYATKDTLPDQIGGRDVTVQISLKIEGDLLKAIRARAKELDKPYQTVMKQLLREQLGMSEEQEPGLAEQVKQLFRDIKGLKSDYKRLAEGRKKLDGVEAKLVRAARSRRG
jgi:hypothetical protein